LVSGSRERNARGRWSALAALLAFPAVPYYDPAPLLDAVIGKLPFAPRPPAQPRSMRC